MCGWQKQSIPCVVVAYDDLLPSVKVTGRDDEWRHRLVDVVHQPCIEGSQRLTSLVVRRIAGQHLVCKVAGTWLGLAWEEGHLIVVHDVEDLIRPLRVVGQVLLGDVRSMEACELVPSMYLLPGVHAAAGSPDVRGCHKHVLVTGMQPAPEDKVLISGLRRVFVEDLVCLLLAQPDPQQNMDTPLLHRCTLLQRVQVTWPVMECNTQGQVADDFRL